MGATDVLLLAVAAGLGFYWVEEAFIIHFHHQGSWSFLGSFPTTEVISDRHGSRLIAGHAIWTSIAGLSIGVALQLRGSRLRIVLTAAAGWLWSALDHGANNYIVNYRDSVSRFFQTITANGRVSLYLFAAGAVLAVILDLHSVYLGLPKWNVVRLTGFPSSWQQAKRVWTYLRLRRQFAYVVARYRR